MTNIRKLLNNEARGVLAGQFLVEAMVAISIITVGIMGVVGLLSNAISLNRVVADEYIATYLASEGIEVVKSIIDTNLINGGATPWNDLGGCSTTCEVQFDDTSLRAFTGLHLKFDNDVYSYDSGSDSIFKRTLTIDISDPERVVVLSHVVWKTRGNIKFSVKLSDTFTNWR